MLSNESAPLEAQNGAENGPAHSQMLLVVCPTGPRTLSEGCLLHCPGAIFRAALSFPSTPPEKADTEGDGKFREPPGCQTRTVGSAGVCLRHRLGGELHKAKATNTESSSSQSSSRFVSFPRSVRASHSRGHSAAVMPMALESGRPGRSAPGLFKLGCLLTSLSFSSLMHKIGLKSIL